MLSKYFRLEFGINFRNFDYKVREINFVFDRFCVCRIRSRVECLIILNILKVNFSLRVKIRFLLNDRIRNNLCWCCFCRFCFIVLCNFYICIFF